MGVRVGRRIKKVVVVVVVVVGVKVEVVAVAVGVVAYAAVLVVVVVVVLEENTIKHFSKNAKVDFFVRYNHAD